MSIIIIFLSDYQMYTFSYVFEGIISFKVLHLILLDGLLRLDKELFKTTKPGLSAYASDPRMVIFILHVLGYTITVASFSESILLSLILHLLRIQIAFKNML